MFTMAKIKDGGTYLERHLAANDYYSENEAVAPFVKMAVDLLEFIIKPQPIRV